MAAADLLAEALARVMDDDGSFGAVTAPDMDTLQAAVARWLPGAPKQPGTLWAALAEVGPHAHKHLLALVASALVESAYSPTRLAAARLYLTWMSVPNVPGTVW
jgi:hypothetical protein